MNHDVESSVVELDLESIRNPLRVVRGRCQRDRCVLLVVGRLGRPLRGEVRHNVLQCLRLGHRTLTLDLTRVGRIDAAGVGELVRAYNVTVAVNGVMQIAHATARVRDMLERVGLFDLLSRHGGAVRGDSDSRDACA
jgi:anti-anti-sigma factor